MARTLRSIRFIDLLSFRPEIENSEREIPQPCLNPIEIRVFHQICIKKNLFNEYLIFLISLKTCEFDCRPKSHILQIKSSLEGLPQYICFILSKKTSPFQTSSMLFSIKLPTISCCAISLQQRITSPLKQTTISPKGLPALHLTNDLL